MKTIDQLDDTEAVYSLYLSAEPHGDQLNLDDPETVRQTVRDAFASVTNPAIADQVMTRLNDEHSAADVTRAALAVLREQKNLSPDVAIRIDDMLADPPHADKMDLGVSLS